MGGVGAPPSSSPTTDRLLLLRSCALPCMVTEMLFLLAVEQSHASQLCMSGAVKEHFGQ